MDDLLSALLDYIEAVREHDEARAPVEYDWDYYGHRYIERVKNAESRFTAALDTVIDERVQKAVAMREP